MKRLFWILATLFQLESFALQKFSEEFLSTQIEEAQKNGSLNNAIEHRLSEIASLNDKWKPFVATEKKQNPSFFDHLTETLETGTLLLESEGMGGTYVLYDERNTPQFLIKPTDEEIFCVHNPKYFASPFLEPRVKEDIPLYLGAQTDALCYEVAKICNLQSITPQASIALVSHPNFFHIYKKENSNLPHEEKLCSIQQYLQDTISLRVLLEDLFTSDAGEETLLELFDQEDFELIQLFLWITFDNDAHVDNFRAYKKGAIYGLKKIDNSLSFPEKNTGFSNALMYFPHAQTRLSENTRKQIKELPINEIKEAMTKFGFESSIHAFENRIKSLKQLCLKEDLTYYDCGFILSRLEKEQ